MQQVFADDLDLFGTLVGVLLALVGLGTLAGTPWTHSGGAVVTVFQLLGAVGTVALGVALVWLAHANA